jgi:hypothetical protein
MGGRPAYGPRGASVLVYGSLLSLVEAIAGGRLGLRRRGLGLIGSRLVSLRRRERVLSCLGGLSCYDLRSRRGDPRSIGRFRGGLGGHVDLGRGLFG